MKNMNQLMKQAKKIQEDMAKAQETLGTLAVTGTAGGGSVTVTMDGHRRFTGIKIAREAVDPEDVEMLEDMILAAVADAEKKVDDLTEEHIGKYTKGLRMPGLF